MQLYFWHKDVMQINNFSNEFLKMQTYLVIDDDPDVLTAVKLLLKTEVKEVVTEKNPENIKHLLAAKKFDMILLDMNFNSSINTGNEGIFWLKKIKELLTENWPLIMITAYGDIDLAVRSLKEGASDFMVKPWHNEKLVLPSANLTKENPGTRRFPKSRPTIQLLEHCLLGEQ